MNDGVLIKDVVSSARAACKSFASCSVNFFTIGGSWRSWENWLTVEIVRRLNNPHVQPFAPYSKSHRRKMDLRITGPQEIAVEVKTSYLTEHELKTWGEGIELPERVLKDLKKLRRKKGDVGRLLLLSTVFETESDLEQYRDKLFDRKHKALKGLRMKWYTCSCNGGQNLLLAVSNKRLPN